MKKFWIGFLIILFSIEAFFIVKNGFTKEENYPPGFKYAYVDIYDPLFKKDGQKFLPNRDKFKSKSFDVIKNKNTVRIFIVGGSVAVDFYDYLIEEDMFNKFVKDKNIEVISAAMGAYDSYRISLVIDEILDYDPDLMIIFSGSNEDYDVVKINLKKYELNRFLRRSWAYRKLQDLTIERMRENNIKIARTKKDILPDYKKNLSKIIEKVKSKDKKVLLCTLPVGFSAFAPSVSNEINKEYVEGKLLFADGKYDKAFDKFRQALQNNPNDALSLHFMAKIYEYNGDFDRAKKLYVKMVNIVYGNSPSFESNKVIRSLAYKNNIPVCDVEETFISISPNGIPKKEFFYDFCHWTEPANFYILKGVFNILSQNKFFLNRLNFSKEDIKEKSENKQDRICFENENIKCKEEKITRRENIAIRKAFNSNNQNYEEVVSCFENIYYMDNNRLWNVQFKREETKYALEPDDNFKQLYAKKEKGFDCFWSHTLWVVAQTYLRLAKYNEALYYLDKAEKFNPNSCYISLSKAVACYNLNNKEAVKINLDQAKQKAKKFKDDYTLGIIEIYSDILSKS